MNYSKNTIVFDRTAFIPDRYFSRKGVSLHFKDMYKDKGKVFPLIAPVRHHMEMAQVKNLLRIQNASKSLLKDKKYSQRSFLKKNNSKEALDETSKTLDQSSLDQTLDFMTQEDENNSVDVEEEEEQEEDEEEDDDVLKELNQSTDTIEKKKKARMESSLDQFISVENGMNEDENRQDFNTELGIGKPNKHRKLTPLEKVEKSKEILRKLETPFEIYNRFTELTKVRGRNASDTNIDPNRLQDILKKLDLVVDIGNTVPSNGRTGQALKELKKVPIQYFHMYRKRHDKYLAKHPKITRNAIFVDHRDSSSSSSQVVLNYQDSNSSLNNITFDAINNTTLGDEIISRINPRDSSKPLAVIRDFKRQMSINWDVDHSELTQNFKETFFSPLHRCVESLEKDPSTLNIFPENQTRPLPLTF